MERYTMSTMFTESMFDDIESNANLQEAVAKTICIHILDIVNNDGTVTSPTDIFYYCDETNDAKAFEHYLDLLEFIQEEDIPPTGYFLDSSKHNHNYFHNHLKLIPNYKEFIQILSNFSTILLNELDSDE